LADVDPEHGNLRLHDQSLRSISGEPTTPEGGAGHSIKGRTNKLTAKTRYVLWARAAGRCEYEGCNKSLIGDLISGKEDKNYGFVAHVVADDPDGPRGDPVRSELLSDDIANLMLLCYVHHKLIDEDDWRGHPEERLLAMKKTHEDRIAIIADIHEDRATHVLRYAANIGSHESSVAYEHVSAALLPERYPVNGRHTIDIEVRGSSDRDHEPEYWANQRKSLRYAFATKVRERIESREIRHLSVFGLAPQPLLIELGRLLGDIAPTTVHQLHREPKGWKWLDGGPSIEFEIRRPNEAVSPRAAPIALVLALSATIIDERIEAVLGADTVIWSISAKNPHNDIMKRSSDLSEFRRLMRSLLNEIKARHGEDAKINVFPAIPVSAAIEVGRVWMPKADLPLVVYDQNNRLGGFEMALEIDESA
uniref:SAVED domain-containing protein n=1 Tax=Methylosinus sp. RM1 TaxID=2583817 RepID=UPI001FEFB773